MTMTFNSQFILAFVILLISLNQGILSISAIDAEVKQAQNLDNTERFVASPLSQYRDDIPSKYVICNENLQLLIKYDGTPACMKLDNAMKLLERGWAKSAPMISNSICDSGCKQKLEKQGFTCHSATKDNNFCTNKKSQIVSEIVIPYGAMSHDDKNYIPNAITVSIGINNTVRWINTDSTPHTIVGDKTEFRSPLLLPNQSWTFAFNKPGEYWYHGESGPWLRGMISVLPVDFEYTKGKPIENWGGEPFLGRYIFREGDSIGYVSNVSILNGNSVLVSLSYPHSTKEKQVELGEGFFGICYKVGEFTTLKTLVLERIDTEQKIVEFREELELRNRSCDELF